MKEVSKIKVLGGGWDGGGGPLAAFWFSEAFYLIISCQLVHVCVCVILRQHWGEARDAA